MSYMVEIGKNIRRRRMDLKMSQEELALRLGMSTCYLGQIERGQNNPSVKKLYALSKELGIPFNSIVFIGPMEGINIEAGFVHAYIPIALAEGIYLYGVENLQAEEKIIPGCSFECIAKCPFWREIARELRSYDELNRHES